MKSLKSWWFSENNIFGQKSFYSWLKNLPGQKIIFKKGRMNFWAGEFYFCQQILCFPKTTAKLRISPQLTTKLFRNFHQFNGLYENSWSKYENNFISKNFIHIYFLKICIFQLQNYLLGCRIFLSENNSLLDKR